MNLKPWLGFVLVAISLLAGSASAQRPPMMPPAFLGGMPGMAQMQSIIMQRHQARTLLYLEAIEELRKNPQAADVPLSFNCDEDENPVHSTSGYASCR